MKPSTVLIVSSFLAVTGCSKGPSGPAGNNPPEIIDFTGSFVPVDTSGVIVNYQSMVIGLDGRPQVAYEWTDSGDVNIQARGSVRYARYDGGQWFIEIVSAENEDAGSPELLIAPDGSPVLFYQVRIDGYNAELKYSRRLEDGGWESESVDSDGYVGTWSSGAFDHAGQLQVAYFAGYPYYDLRFARRIDGNWHKELVDSDAETGYHVQLLVNQADEVCIGYGSINPWGVRLASHNSSGWNLETVRENVGHNFAMTVNELGNPIFAIRDGSFFLSARDGSDWILEPIDSENSAGIEPSGLERDASGTLWVVYSSEVDLRVAWRQDAWQSRSITNLYPGGLWRGLSVLNDPIGVSVLFTSAENHLIYGSIQPVFRAQ
jgi:hypothetical protein